MARHAVIIMRQCHECATCVPEPCMDDQDYVLCTRHEAQMIHHQPANETQESFSTGA